MSADEADFVARWKPKAQAGLRTALDLLFPPQAIDGGPRPMAGGFSADAWNNYAFLCRETKRFEEAFVGYQHAIEREPESPQLWNDAAVVLHYHLANDTNRTRAKQMYDRAIELANAQLAEASTTEILRQRAERAKADALLNLKELGK